MNKLTVEDTSHFGEKKFINFKGRVSNISEWFRIGMDRELNFEPFNLERAKEGDVNSLNLGAGIKFLEGSEPLQLPDWDAEKDSIPYDDETFDCIHAYHFLEHLNNLSGVLSECQRVLKDGGVMNIVVPYYNSQLAFQDPDHKRFFTENTWRTLFHNDYYDTSHGAKRKWEFEVISNFIIGLSEKNLSLFTQLRKVK